MMWGRGRCRRSGVGLAVDGEELTLKMAFIDNGDACLNREQMGSGPFVLWEQGGARGGQAFEQLPATPSPAVPQAPLCRPPPRGWAVPGPGSPREGTEGRRLRSWGCAGSQGAASGPGPACHRGPSPRPSPVGAPTMSLTGDTWGSRW